MFIKSFLVYEFIIAISITSLNHTVSFQNLLNNFPSSDIMSAIARMFLLFQMITVFPLLLYIFRIQVLDTIFGSIYPR